jgi:catechol 2,3-dioxygenase-like lactoylglutathione lyase family enzyme
MQRPLRKHLQIALVLLALAISAGAQAPLVTGVPAIGMTVSDMDRSIAFYSEVLGFRAVSDAEVHGAEWEQLFGVFPVRARIVRMRLGDEQIELTEFLVPRGRPIPLDARSNDLWFQHIAIIVRDMDQAYAHLRNHKVQHASSGPQTLPEWNKNAGGIKAFYFRDPDGHTLEILQFPPGKGQEKWRRAGSNLFLGIDHTAIAVSDTERSLAFYRDLLGLKIAGESENYGPEQERLNAVFGARLRITALRAASGPGVELLEYIAPRDGRPSPSDLRANDIAFWQTTLAVPDVDIAFSSVRRARAQLISSGVIVIGPGRKLLFRDPDGHAIACTSLD